MRGVGLLQDLKIGLSTIRDRLIEVGAHLASAAREEGPGIPRNTREAAFKRKSEFIRRRGDRGARERTEAGLASFGKRRSKGGRGGGRGGRGATGGNGGGGRRGKGENRRISRTREECQIRRRSTGLILMGQQGLRLGGGAIILLWVVGVYWSKKMGEGHEKKRTSRECIPFFSAPSNKCKLKC